MRQRPKVNRSSQPPVRGAEEVITKLEKRIEDEINEAVRSAEKEKERIISRRQSVADIDSKKMILQKKQELISQCFDEAVDYIIGMEEKKYTDFLARLGADSGVKGGETHL